MTNIPPVMSDRMTSKPEDDMTSENDDIDISSTICMKDFEQEPINLVFKITKYQRVKSRKVASLAKAPSKVVCPSSQGPELSIRRDIANKSMLRGLRKYFKKLFKAELRKLKLSHIQENFLEIVKATILRKAQVLGIIPKSTDYTTGGVKHLNDLDSRVLDILCWCIIPQCHHNMLVDNLYKSGEILLLDSIFKKYSHKIMTKVFKSRSLKQLFGYFILKGINDKGEADVKVCKKVNLYKTVADFQLNFDSFTM